MSAAWRLRWYGSSILLAVAGTVVIVASDTVVAEAAAIGLISLGLVIVVSLMFYEVGLSEDRARANERAAAEEEAEREAPTSPAAPAARRLTPSHRRRRRG